MALWASGTVVVVSRFGLLASDADKNTERQ